MVLATGGLVLFRSPAGGASPLALVQGTAVATGSGVAFSGPGAHGTLALSHTRVLAGGERRLFAELRLVADSEGRQEQRAPLSMVIVLDTSGSMEGEKPRRLVLRT